MTARAGRVDGRNAALAWCAALAVLALLQLGLARAEVAPYDEGLILYGAARVARGDVPYRDFWSMYGPAGFYVLAALDHVFGESLLTGRAFDAVCRAAVVVLVFALTRRRAGRPAAATAAALAFALLAYGRGYLAVSIPATACVLLAMLALDRALLASAVPDSSDSGSATAVRAWALAGVAAGAATLFRHDFGLASVVACLCALPPAAGAAPRERSTGRRLGAFGAGFGLVVVPALAALLGAVPASDLFEQLVAIPMHVYAAQRSLPFPTPADAIRGYVERHRLGPTLSLVVYAPPVVCVLGLGRLLALRARTAPASARSRVDLPWYFSLLVLDTLLTIKGSIRVELLHFIPALTVSIVLVTNALGSAAPARRRRRLSAAVAALLCAAVVLAAVRAAAPQPADAEPAPTLLLLARSGCAPAPRLGCFRVEPGEDLVLDRLRREAHADDTLYVGTGRHDRLFINNVELYFLSGLRAATRWHDLHPGVQTTAAVQAAMVREMSAHPPAFVVLNTAWDDRDEPNLSRLSSGVTLLDDFIRTHYTVVLEAGTYSLRVPRVARAPA